MTDCRKVSTEFRAAPKERVILRAIFPQNEELVFQKGSNR
jgi:hypothetical protein